MPSFTKEMNTSPQKEHNYGHVANLIFSPSKISLKRLKLETSIFL